jgi:hypothetical protein
MTGVTIKCMQWARRRARASWQANQDEEYKRKKRKWNVRITVAIAIFMVGLYLFAISPLGAYASTAQQKDTTAATEDRAYVAINAAVQPYNKAVTLRSGASAALTAYPAANSSNTLSSSTIDEQTGNLSYKRGMGKGDETLSGNSNNSNGGSNNCGGFTISGGGRGHNASFQVPPCPTYSPDSHDFMTGTDGIVLQFPATLTTDNPVVQAALGAVQVIAFACITPLIVLIGLNVMNGAITMRFADGIQALSRLVPVAVGIGFSLTLVQFLFSLEAALTQVFTSFFGNMDMSSVILPTSSWFGTLVMFLTLGLALTVAKSFAPLLISVLGTGITVGVFIAVAAEGAIYSVLIIEIPRLILVIFAMGLCVQILMRIVLVNFYIIMSPLAIVASLLPGRSGVGFTRDWILGFLSLLASQFAQVVVLLLGLVLLNVVKDNTLVRELIKYGTLTLMLRVPSLFRSSATGLAAQIGPSVAGAVAGPFLAFVG